ncbi:MAG: hypothetical protein ACI9JN_002412 [Bacteroidia bacterium]|jgi:hypothetical protein
MKTASLKDIKDELKHVSEMELLDLCLSLARFKKENKELLTYLLFNAANEARYIESVKQQIVEDLTDINTATYYWMKKTIRKVLRNTKKYIRYSKKKETEVELILFFCQQMLDLEPSIKRNTTLWNIYLRQMSLVQKSLNQLHEDLQYDFQKEINEMPS